jgi:hypothetical protein
LDTKLIPGELRDNDYVKRDGVIPECDDELKTRARKSSGLGMKNNDGDLGRKAMSIRWTKKFWPNKCVEHFSS